MQNEQTQKISSLDFLKRAYPNLQVGKFSHDTQGIYYNTLVSKSDLEKINHLGFDVEYIQPWDEGKLNFGVILVVKERGLKI